MSDIEVTVDVPTPAVAVTVQQIGGQGPIGDSAYKVAVKNGYSGSEAEWLASLEGADGESPELRQDSGYVQWRLPSDASWTNIVALADLAGADGREVALRSDGTNIQWQYVGDSAWTDIVPLASLKGDDGPTAVSADAGNSASLGSDGLIFVDVPAPVAPTWGGIGGDIAAQSDLQSALDAKADSASLGTAAAADVGDFATAAQGAAADTAVQPADIVGLEKTLTAGANITIDRTDPAAPVISASGGGGTGGGSWGSITGTLADQTDLKDALDAKVDASALGTAAAADATDFATAAQGVLADSAVQPGDLGTAATAATTDFAPAGTGVPTGGTTGQVLAKTSGTDYDTQWVDQSGGGGSDLAIAEGSAMNPHTDAAAARNTSLPKNFWQTSTEPANWVDGDEWIVK